MLAFPQLITGAGGQFPIVRRRRYTAVSNILPDGTTIDSVETSPRTTAWELALRGLTDLEAAAIAQLFQAVEGRRKTFVFLDPSANLLAHSEEPDARPWSKGPLLQITTGMSDPAGGTRGIRLINAGQTMQSLTQSLAAPAWYGYAFSVYARSNAGSALTLASVSLPARYARQFTLASDWMRCVNSSGLEGTAGSIQFALELEAGASVEIFGVQVESQPAASTYKRTGARGGVYSNARFDEDVLRLVSDGPDQHRVELRIVARD